MRIVFAGTPDTAVPSLIALASSADADGIPERDGLNEHEVVGVITREDAPIGRKRVLTPSPVAQAAEKLGLPVLKTNVLNDVTSEWVDHLDADLGVIVAYGGLVREPLLSRPRLGWINLHFSELPRWRGAAPVQRALQAGEQQLGLSVFRLVEALDAGRVLARDQIDFEAGTTATQALALLAQKGTEAIEQAIRVLAADPEAGEEQVGEASYAQKLSREDGRLELSDSTSAVLAHWAGVTSAPGAYVHFEGQPLKILELRSTQIEGPEVVAGEVKLVGGKALLGLHDGALELVRVQPAGKAAMPAADWLRGRGGEAKLV